MGGLQKLATSVATPCGDRRSVGRSDRLLHGREMGTVSPSIGQIVGDAKMHGSVQYLFHVHQSCIPW